MADDQQPDRVAVVFGARNLGRAIIHTMLGAGWKTVGVALSQPTLDGVRQEGATAFRGDVTDPESVRDVLAQAVSTYGSVDLVVNAASAYGGEGSGPFGGGSMSEAEPGAFEAWAVAPARSAFGFFSGASRFLLAKGRPATLVQVTGGSSRRAIKGKGLWAAGAFGVRAITQAAALELRPKGIHAVLLIVDAGIEPLAGAGVADLERLADPYELGQAVLFLANQGARSATHELQVTPLAEGWTP